ncbi:MAG: HEAT repeat domain-containing protein [bacterium]|nr:HEAT repeat domain-containing protein [bacterium]
MKQRKIFLTMILAAGVLIMGFLLVRYLNKPRPFHWEKDARLMYRIKTTNVIHANIPIPGSRPLRKRLTLKGILNMRILEVSPERILAVLQLSPVTVKADGVPQTDAGKLYSHYFFAHISPQGEFLRFDFNSGISPDDEKNMSNIIKTFQCIITEKSSSQWDGLENDTHGRVAVNYSVEKDSILKKKSSYEQIINRDGQVDGEAAIKILRSEYKAAYSEKETWLSTMEGKELLGFLSDGKMYLKISSRVSLKKIPFNPNPNLALWHDLDYYDITKQWSGKPKNTISLALYTERKGLRNRIGNSTIESYLKTIFKKHMAFTSAAIKEIAEYIKLYPEEALKIPPFLLSQELNVHQRAMLTHALAKVGHDRAQEALVIIMEDKVFKKDNRVQAVMAFASISRPKDESISSLWEMYDQEDQDKDLASTAILSLGSIAGTLEKNPNEAGEDRSREIKQRIDTGLSSEENLNKRIALIYAAGNTGDTSFVEPISSFFNAENPNVRSTAAASLTHLKNEEVDTILCDQLTKEENINVRGSLVTALYKREPTEQSVGMVLEQVAVEENDIVRGGMYRYLLKNRNKPGVKEALVELKKTERAMEHRRLINRALNTLK